ncbi:hypothetical protein JXA85_04600, partial [Candidatus Woesearchaeota archaeon]|nr:hypothetical protein [Candidatus Woesearchaeota archaeon]
MINRMLNSRASRAFKLESKLQLFLIVVIVLMSANIISATNITDNSSINNLSGNFAGQTTTIIDINITVNITGINSTKINMTPEVNETANITNETDNNAVEKLNVTINESGETEIAHFVYGQETTQLEAEISKPVLWITKRTAVNATNITFILPKDADTEKINANNTEDISNLIIEKEENETKVTITLNQICSDDYYLLYQTPAPVLGLINESIENNIYRKFIIAKSNSTLNYADVLCRLNL